MENPTRGGEGFAPSRGAGMNATATIRFLLIAVGTTAVLYRLLSALGVSDASLERDVIVLGFIGVAIALVVEFFLKRKAGSPPEKPT